MSFAQAGLHNIQDLVATHAITESAFRRFNVTKDTWLLVILRWRDCGRDAAKTTKRTILKHNSIKTTLFSCFRIFKI